MYRKRTLQADIGEDAESILYSGGLDPILL
jgi:hypothetical protein